MDPQVKAEYDKLLTILILRNGTLVDEDRIWSPFWSAAENALHMRTCPPASTGRVDEDYWHEFMGTFYEGDTSVHGLCVRGVTCSCGKVCDGRVRWRAPMQEVAELVFEELYKQRQA